MKSNPHWPGGLLKSKPTWSSTSGALPRRLFSFLASSNVRNRGGMASWQEWFLLAKGRSPAYLKGY